MERSMEKTEKDLESKKKKGISNKVWQRRSFKVKYPSNIVNKTLAG